MKLTFSPGDSAAGSRPVTAESAFSLVELLVVLAIMAAVAGLVTTAVLRTLAQQEEKQCLANMLLIEAAKDEYARDHPNDSAPNVDQFMSYLRSKMPPRCPRNPNEDYVNWNNLDAAVSCRVHPGNSVKLNRR
ncbi:MAG TPA: type II secretion system protein [Chthoniobacterales bacterium]